MHEGKSVQLELSWLSDFFKVIVFLADKKQAKKIPQICLKKEQGASYLEGIGETWGFLVLLTPVIKNPLTQ